MSPRRPTEIPTTEHLLESDFAQRKLAREIEICGVAKGILGQCSYRRAARSSVWVLPAVEHGVVALRVRDASAIWLYLASPMRWFDEVYRGRLASVSGCIVLQIEKTLEDGSAIVQAVKQARGCSLTLAYGLVHMKEQPWILEFKSLPPEYSHPPPNPKHTALGRYYETAQRRQAALVMEKLYGGSRRS